MARKQSSMPAFPVLTLVDACSQLLALETEARAAIARKNAEGDTVIAEAIDFLTAFDDLARELSLMLHLREQRWQKAKRNAALMLESN